MDMWLVEAPEMRPHTCIDGEHKGPLVDTGITHLPYGRVYLSKHTVHDAGRLLGMLQADDVASLTTERDDLRARVLELEGELAELQPVRDALTRFGSSDDKTIPARPAPRRKAAA